MRWYKIQYMGEMDMDMIKKKMNDEP